jgi:hypothetical protein
MKTLYTESKNGVRHFSGEVIETGNDKLVAIYDGWNHSEVMTEVPVGINMRLIRAMEEYTGVYRTHVSAKRATHKARK